MASNAIQGIARLYSGRNYTFLRRAVPPPPQFEGDFSKGIIRDSPRTAIPASGVYDSADFLLHQPGVAIKRGGTSYAGPAMTSANYAVSVTYAEFPAGAKLCATGDNGNLYTITAGTTTNVGNILTGAPGDVPKVRIGGGKNLLIFTANDGTTAPVYYDGTGAGTLGGSPPGGKFLCIYKTRVVLANTSANPNRIFFSPTPDPTTTWDTTTSWIDADYPITGVAALHNALLIFSQGHTERIIGSTPPPGTDMDRAPVGSIGCTDSRSIVVQEGNAIFANPRGVYLTNGAGFASLTTEGFIETYWQSLLSGYDPTTWTISAGIYRSFLVVSVLDNNGAMKATLMCNVPRRAWWRVTNVRAAMFGPAVGAGEELYYADRETNRVTTMSGMFSPASGNKNDANGTAVTPFLETRSIGAHIPGLKRFGYGRLGYDMRDAATDNPTMSVKTSQGVEATSYATVVESPLVKTTDEKRAPFTIAKDSQGVSLQFQQTNASSKTEIYGLEVEMRPYQQEYKGQ